MKKVAVLTGDIISSGNLSIQNLDEIKYDLVQQVQQNFDLLLPMEFYRGDGFQLVTKTVDALKAALFLRSYLIWKTEEKSDARLSTGIARAEKLGKNVRESNGEAFILSGKAFDKLGKKNVMLFSLAPQMIQEELNTEAHLFEVIINGWTKLMASCICLSLTGLNQETIAQKLKISQPAVSKALVAAHWQQTQTFLKRFGVLIKNG